MISNELALLPMAFSQVLLQTPSFIQVTLTEVKTIGEGTLFKLELRADGTGFSKPATAQIFEALFSVLKETSCIDYIQLKFGPILSLVTMDSEYTSTAVDSIGRSLLTAHETPDKSQGLAVTLWILSKDELPVYTEEMVRYLNLLEPQIGVQLLLQSFIRDSLYHQQTFLRGAGIESQEDENTIVQSIKTDELSLYLRVELSDDSAAHTCLAVRTAVFGTLQVYETDLFELIRASLDKADLGQFGVVVYEVSLNPLALFLTTSFASGMISEAELTLNFTQITSIPVIAKAVQRLFMEISCRCPALFNNTPNKAKSAALSSSIAESLSSILTCSTNPEFIATAFALTRSHSIEEFGTAVSRLLDSQLPC